VCLSVCWSCGCSLQKRLNRSRCRLGADSCGPKEPRITWGQDPHGWGQFGCCPAQWKRPMKTDCLLYTKVLFPNKWWQKTRNNQLKPMIITKQSYMLQYVTIQETRAWSVRNHSCSMCLSWFLSLRKNPRFLMIFLILWTIYLYCNYPNCSFLQPTRDYVLFHTTRQQQHPQIDLTVA